MGALNFPYVTVHLIGSLSSAASPNEGPIGNVNLTVHSTRSHLILPLNHQQKECSFAEQTYLISKDMQQIPRKPINTYG